ncbi:MAG: hypothetical protein LBC70_03015 [Chitinispirillales bacterium]|jgi:hypothetical protein|nr:hypothetical protein [Chitinispirillales bacterium]
MAQGKYKVVQGPEAYFPPAAAIMGVTLPDAGDAIAEGEIVPESSAVELIARKLKEAKNPVICPGPLIVWQWSDDASPKAAAVKELAEACKAKILPMQDYRAKRINPAAEISPNHPNVTILHNEIDVCVFVGVHSHFENVALRLIRGGTNCYTIALSEYAASDEAMISLRDAGVEKIKEIIKILKET